MKKTVSFIIALTLIFIMLPIGVYADEMEAKTSGPSSIRKGDTLTVSLTVSGSNLVNALCKVYYDPDVLTYKSIKGAASGWEFDESAVTDVPASERPEADLSKSLNVIGETDDNAISSKTELFRISFTVKASEGESIGIRFMLDASDGDNDYSASASYSQTVSRPYSSDSSLSSLSVEGYELSESFDPEKTVYTLNSEVEYTTSRITVNAKASDGGAKVEVSGNRLSVGENTIYIKVTAEDGKTSSTYRIELTMKQDPNYVMSSDARLDSIDAGKGLISPAFSPDRCDYIVYLPFEESAIELSGTPKDKKASCESVTSELIVGENVLTLVCTAEDGSTLEYVITVVRMEEYGATGEDTSFDTDTSDQTGDGTATEEGTDSETVGGTEPDTTDQDGTDEPSSPSESTADTESGESTDKATENNEGIYRPVPLWMVAIVAIVGLLVGVLGTCMVFKLK